MRSSRTCGWDLAEWLERPAANAKFATVLGSIPASSDTVESEGRQMKQCWRKYIQRKNQVLETNQNCCIQNGKGFPLCWWEMMEFLISDSVFKNILKLNLKARISWDELQSLTTMTLVHLLSSLQADRLICHWKNYLMSPSSSYDLKRSSVSKFWRYGPYLCCIFVQF